jgi:hypothetical protein
MINKLNKITENIIGSAIAVHKELGPGLLESAYETSFAKVGLLINFNVKVLKNGLRRLVLDLKI